MKWSLRTGILILVSITFTCLTSMAQDRLKFEIASFEADPFDYSANDPQFEKFDGNGDRYAIIKITSNNPDDNLNEFKFNFGNMKHIVEDHNGVLWVYVQKNAKLVTISRDGYTPINKYDLHTTIESGKNYVMSLTTEDKKILTQMVRFNVKPENVHAVIMIKSYMNNSPEELFGNTDATGSVAKSLEYGTYTYRVLADNYHTSEGRFKLDNKNEVLTENVVLQPNFSDITLKVDGNAQIYINGELKGTRQWTGPLKAGSYQVECREQNHTPSSQTITVTENDNRIINLKAPTPILGTVAITSTPLGADIEIDGKNYGQTPKNIELVIGSHVVTLSKPNYKTEKETFEVGENKTTNVDISLNQNTKVTIKSNAGYKADIYIDGIYRGNTPYDFEGNAGNHEIKLVAGHPYKDFKKNMYLGNEEEIYIPLNKLLFSPIYLGVGASYGNTLSVSGAFGLYLGYAFGSVSKMNWNVEFFYDYGLQDVADLYWNYTDEDNYPEHCNYKPNMIMGAKIGYGILAGSRFVFTPQVGYRYTSLSESGSGNSFINKANCSSVTAGLRIYCAFSSHFGVSLTPEYAFGVQKSEGFNILSDVSSKIKNLSDGFKANLSLVISF